MTPNPSTDPSLRAFGRAGERLLAAVICFLAGAASGCSSDASSGQEDTGRPIPDVAQDVDEDSGARDTELEDSGSEDASPDDADSGDTQPNDGGPVDVDADDAMAADVSDAADGDVDDGDVDDVGDADPADVEVVECPTPPAAFTGVLVEDLDHGTLDVGDRVRITVGVHAEAPSDEAIRLVIEHGNVAAEPATARLDDEEAVVDAPGDRWTVALPATADATLVYEGVVESEDQLVTVFSSLTGADARCPVPRSRAGALFQVAGGETKTPGCIDMSEFRSVQVAPYVPLQNTDGYAASNGVRDDLVADAFIFCPQNPTIVHAAEFCLERSDVRDVALSGNYLADSTWEVDDFILVEVFQRGLLTADGFTTQHHSGGSSFYCSETDTLMCTDGCTAELVEVATGRRVDAIADADSEGPTPRRHDDGDVLITSLLPAPGTVADVRVTALDTGIEGTLTPALYLVSSPDE